MSIIMIFEKNIFFKGCPATGCYGSNGSLPCPDVNCQDCHKETGTCQVCKPGYKGQQCELGMYFMFYISFKL